MENKILKKDVRDDFSPIISPVLKLESKPFGEWLEKYGERIALFGGSDMSFICSSSENDIRIYVEEIMGYSAKYPGFALGTGNSVPDYMPVENYITMVETARKFRDRFILDF